MQPFSENRIQIGAFVRSTICSQMDRQTHTQTNCRQNKTPPRFRGDAIKSTTWKKSKDSVGKEMDKIKKILSNGYMFDVHWLRCQNGALSGILLTPSYYLRGSRKDNYSMKKHESQVSV